MQFLDPSLTTENFCIKQTKQALIGSTSFQMLGQKFLQMFGRFEVLSKLTGLQLAFRYGARQSFLMLKYKKQYIFLDNLHIMDGTFAEDQRLKKQLVSKGILIPLPKYQNCYLARTDPNVSQFCIDRQMLLFLGTILILRQLKEWVGGF